jgi:ATP-dependent protease ClpP protease subunit
MANGIIKHRYLTFFGPILQPLTNNLWAAVCGLVNEGAEELTILFASDGGSTHDGISLYAYLLAQPLKINMHAIGIVGSIAIPVFLASEHRHASKHARFHFHEYSWTQQAGNLTKNTMDEQALLLDGAVDWSKDVIKSRTKLTDEDFDKLKLFDHPHLMTASAAAKHGIVSAVKEATVPVGSQHRVVV